MPRVRRRLTAVKPPAVAKKRYEYDDGSPEPEKTTDKTQPKAPARKAATKK